MIQANLNLSAGLREKFHKAQTPDGPRTICVKIKAETLVFDSEKKNSGDVLVDFSAITSDVTENCPAFYLFNKAAGTADTKQWGLVAYVPELSPVRQRMLYASSRDDLKNKLGSSYFAGEFYCNDKADLTFANFTYALEGSTAETLESVMTEKEKLMKEEGATATAAAASSAGMSVVPFKFKAELDEAMSSFYKGDSIAVEIAVNGKTEQCYLGKLSGDATLATLEKNFPKQPRFFCLNYGRKVFVFYCPDEAKVRTKMLMATCKSAVIAQAFEKHKIKFDKQVEVRDFSEIPCNFEAAKAPSDEAAAVTVTKAKRKTRGKRRLNTKGKKFNWA